MSAPAGARSQPDTAVEELVEFGVSEYTLVFRRSRATGEARRLPHFGWMVARPSLVSALAPMRANLLCAEGAESTDGVSGDGEIAEMFMVPVCSTLALDPQTYERFLSQSGVLERALRHLARMRLNGPRSVETTRKRIQSLVMAAEVQFIVEGMIA